VSESVAEHNRRMWDRLAEAGHVFTQPRGGLPRRPGAIRRMIDPHDRLEAMDLRGADVLVIAGGGGWDAIGFAELGANVTLLDISERQLDTVRRLAARRRARPSLEQGDMNDLSRFGRATFDLVWHMHSLVFVSEPERVFREVARVLRAGGTYWTGTMHPMAMRMYEGWTGTGWTLRNPYAEPGPIRYEDDTWDDGRIRVDAPTIEYGHTIERLVNGIAAAGLLVDGLWEYTPDPAADPRPGSSEHVEATFPAYVEIRARKGRVRLRRYAVASRRDPVPRQR
jgi:SAM-dependent methyltransferase